MTSKFLSESTHGGSNLDIELSQHCKKSPELYLQAILDASASCIAVLDESGNILYVNRAWRQLAIRNGLKPSLQGAGTNYLVTCRHTTGAGPHIAREIKEGITQILLGQEMEFEREYICEGKTGRRTGLLHAA